MFANIRAQAEITIVKHVADAVASKLQIQASNVVLRRGLYDMLLAQWALQSGGSMAVYANHWPWRIPAQYDGQDLNVKHGFGFSHGGGGRTYTYNTTSLNVLDERRCRRIPTTGLPWNYLKASPQQVLGALLTTHTNSGVSAATTVAATDIPLRMIGNPWKHPGLTCTFNIVLAGAAGQAYLSTFSNLSGTFTGQGATPAGGHAYLRITSGVDAGVYRMSHWDTINNRIYLRNLDGTTFVPAGGAQTAVTGLIYYRVSAYFNENAIIPSSQGDVAFSGVYDPGTARQSRLVRLHFEKSGSPSPAGGPHLTGSYWYTSRPYIYGAGPDNGVQLGDRDDTSLSQSIMPYMNTAISSQMSVNGFYGSCLGMVLDTVNQRLWGITRDPTTTSDIWWWLYKSTENFHEPATNSGTSQTPIAGITLASSNARGIAIGADRTVYVAASGTNAGLIRITEGLVGSQWLASSAGLAATLNGLAIDKTRARTIVGGITTLAATNTVEDADSGFSQADVGRVIVLTTGVDAGSYLISAYISATQVSVTTLGGGAVSFTGGLATHGMSIGDRIYLFWNDTTTNAGVMRYMDSQEWGVVRTQAVAMTNGAQLYDGHATYKQRPAANVDPLTGNVFWVSSDTAQKINRYNVSTRTVSQKTLSTFTAPADASGYTTPTLAYGIDVNPHASFREVWVGTNYGWIRFNPDHADLSTLTSQNPYAWTLASNQYRRYYGDGSATLGQQPAGYLHLDGRASASNTICSCAHFSRDGKVYGLAANASQARTMRFDRELDSFAPHGDTPYIFGPYNSTNQTMGMLITDTDEVVLMCPANNSSTVLSVSGVPVDFQWIGLTWVPKEVIRGVIPDATSSPGCATKALHTAAEDIGWGVKVAFSTGAGTDMVQFIGRMYQKQALQADGAWAAGTTSQWRGSNFTAADVGRILRVESGTQQGTYKVSAYVNATTLTVQTIARGTFTAATEAGPLNYTLWDHGTPDAGGEVCTVVLADGLFADNTQDIYNIWSEFYFAKTQLSQDEEAIKVAYGTLPPPGSPGYNVVAAGFGGGTEAPGDPSGLGFSTYGAAITLPGDMLAYAAGRRNANGNNGQPSSGSQPGALRGRDAGANDGGYMAVDFGIDVEIGAVIMRITSQDTVTYEAYPHMQTDTANVSGMLGNLHRATEADGQPVDAVHPTHTRLSGTGCSIPRTWPATATLSTGNFLGTSSVTYTDGVTVQGGNTVESALGRFTGLTGGVLQLTSGSDLGYYRITDVSPDGSTATVRNLDQTAKAWASSAGVLSFVYYADAAREDDVFRIAGVYQTTVEMLTSPTTARLRTYAPLAQTNVAWYVMRPTWRLVKRLSYSSMALPPDVTNNGTYTSTDGGEEGDMYDGSNYGRMKAVFSLLDLTTAQRTGRYWKFSYMGRFTPNNGVTNPSLPSFEFYDTSGKRLMAAKSNHLDTVESEPDFLACHITRVDWIQAQYAASALVPGVNALASNSAKVVTLAGAAKFLPHRVFLGSTITAAGGSSTIAITGADRPFGLADPGRIIWIQAGPNAGYYRVSTTPTATSATLVTMAGVAVTLNADATPRAWSLHEGILAGTSLYDRISLGSHGEFGIASVSNDLTTITLNDEPGFNAAGQTWEIRRRATPVAFSTANFPQGVNAALVARLTYSHMEGPRQSGDLCQDHLGAIIAFGADVGVPLTKSDGATTAATAGFTGSGFSPDDVGRALIITTGADKGPYEIATYVSSTQVTVKNPRTHAAVSFSATAGTLSYKVQGERRFRASRYVTVLRQ